MARKGEKLEVGTVYQKSAGGNYYFRYQVGGKRKAVSLKTKNKKDALLKAKDMIPIIKASSAKVVAEHVMEINGWKKKEQKLELTKAWEIYNSHPDKANPATVNVYNRYQKYFTDFVNWALAHELVYLDEVTDVVVMKYIEHLKLLEISVDTHNKRVKRVAQIFRVLREYTSDNTSDWSHKNFIRKAREEIGITARRLPFTKEQEADIFRVLDDPKFRVCNKPELKVLFYIGCYTGQRLKDCALLQWHKVDLEKRRIYVAQFKTGKEVTIPIAAQLLNVLNTAKTWAEDTYVLPKIARRYQKKDSQGRDVGAALINNDTRRVVKWIGLDPSVNVPGRKRAVAVYGFHSLRHSVVSHFIANNISKAVAVSILGADSDIIDQYYTHVGVDAQELAIQAISGSCKSPTQRVEDALNYISQLTRKSQEIIEIEAILVEP